MSYLFTSESVSKGHPDKICDQISDGLVDAFLSKDPNSKVACETLVTTGLVMCSGEVNTNGYVQVDDIARNIIKKIGYDKSDYQFDYKSCGVLSSIHSQSPDISMGVNRKNDEEQGAGDQGIMFGYACKDTTNYMPLAWDIANKILMEIDNVRNCGNYMQYARPDAKSQVTVKYNDDGTPNTIDTIVVSVQHDDLWETENEMQKQISYDLRHYVLPRVIENYSSDIQKLFNEYRLLVNPTGKFVIGGPHGDTGVTGRKIIVDTYGGVCPHGGGAFSGKDPSKVDRSAAYAARHIAKNLVASGVCDRACVQLAYAIGVAEPVGFYVNTYNTKKIELTDGVIAEKLKTIFRLRPYDIIKRFGLKNPIYLPTASYGHFGKDAYEDYVKVGYNDDTTIKDVDGNFKKRVTFFGWEKLDMVNDIKKLFNL